MASLFNRAPYTYSVLFSITGIDTVNEVVLTFALNVLSIKMFALFKSL